MNKYIREYLALLNNIVGMSYLYGIDDKRIELHKKILAELPFDADYEDSKPIFDNLDKIIDFNPPLARHDSIKVYARQLEIFLWGSRYFFSYTKLKHGYRMNIPYSSEYIYNKYWKAR